MAEPRGPLGPQEDWSYSKQPLITSGQDGSAGQVSGQPSGAVSESFGAFGPLPEYTQEKTTPVPPSAPASQPPAPGAMPGSALPVTPAYPMPGLVPNGTTLPPQPAAAPYPQVVAPAPQGYGYAPAYPYAPAIPTYLPAPPARKQKKPVRFPLTRKAPALLQVAGMLLYGLVMVISIMLCALTLLRAYVNNASVYFYANGDVNGSSVLITGVLILVLAPACSLFCGALFGSWRGLLVSLFAVSGGLVLAHLTDARVLNANTGPQTYLLYASLPLSALITGLIYDRRVYAAWWKSMFTMFLGVAIPVISAAVLLYAQTAPDATLNAALTHSTAQSYLATIAIVLGCVTLLLIPLLGLLYAGIEGILHAIIARIFPAH